LNNIGIHVIEKTDIITKCFI